MEDVKDPFLLKFCGKIGKDFTKCRMKNSFDHIVVIVKKSFVDLVDIVKVSFVDNFSGGSKIGKDFTKRRVKNRPRPLLTFGFNSRH